jgi:hypothetical protein
VITSSRISSRQDQQQAVAIADFPQLAEVLRRRHQDPPGSLDRLGDHGGNGLGSFPLDHLLDVVRAQELTVREVLLELAAEAVGHRGGHEVRLGLIEGVIGRKGRGASGGSRDAVIGPAARQHLLALVVAAHRVIQAGDAEVGLVGIGATGGEEKVIELAIGGEQRREPLTETDGGLVGEVPERRVIGHPPHLLCDRVGDLGSPVPDVDVEEAGEPVDDAVSTGRLEADSLSAHDDAGSLHLVDAKLGDGMDQMGAIQLL